MTKNDNPLILMRSFHFQFQSQSLSFLNTMSSASPSDPQVPPPSTEEDLIATGMMRKRKAPCKVGQRIKKVRIISIILFSVVCCMYVCKNLHKLKIFVLEIRSQGLFWND